MNSLIFVVISGSIGVLSYAGCVFLIHRRISRSRAEVRAKIEKAERELLDDLSRIGVSELRQTQAGRELLASLGGIIFGRALGQKHWELVLAAMQELARKAPASAEMPYIIDIEEIPWRWIALTGLMVVVLLVVTTAIAGNNAVLVLTAGGILVASMLVITLAVVNRVTGGKLLKIVTAILRRN